ncbi:putative murein hydrolase (TIGR00659 family) [Pseudochelatococcus lubricantis]|uniref:Murein hydrolase (TIGR00659 family) n=1 Tax=Pseudochelatococcus lubricantis TaxID=1538102 RepID=A0ABX0V0G5_9HYPH|nr:LrgB family protein [Pseudochelatococcus lubricantis]NIJ58699.1 putative murein hydrolase (TIGR00659 family) [Pseudochelatococcus lubricantis]
MNIATQLWSDPLARAAFWSVTTIVFYLFTKALYRRWPRWWLLPMGSTPALLVVAMLLLDASYADYIRGTHWLMALLGPTVVAFAVPIYQRRALIRRHWPVLALGMVVGSMTALASSWAIATVLGLDGTLRLSLLPRSISTPFAMTVSSEIGGIPDLTAVFVVATGVAGAAIGGVLLSWLPLRSSIARGSLFGMGAHGAGTARAYEVGAEEGAVAGLIMVLVGLLNVLIAPVLVHAFQ